MLAVFVISSSSTELLRFSTQNDRVRYEATYTSTVPATLLLGGLASFLSRFQNRSPSVCGTGRVLISIAWLSPTISDRKI